MKKLLLLSLAILYFSSTFADIGVKSFNKLEHDMDARIHDKLMDNNNELCAIIKVVTTETGFYFDGGTMGIYKTVNKPAEIWVYVSRGMQRITITHAQLGKLIYNFLMPIEAATVYEMRLATGRVITTVEENTIESQWLVIKPEPANALVYLNDEFVKTGEYQAKHTPGIYNCRVELPLYHTHVERFEITNTRKNLDVKLKPAFGYIQIASQPESNAQVFVDGTLQKENTPVTTAAIASGEHTVQVIKDMYQPFVQRITVKDGETSSINAVLNPNFAELSINAPSRASIILNNQQKGTGSWNGRLSAGVYSIEARLQSHKPARQDIELKIGEQRTINLQPTPIYGSLDVMTSPSGANITINGKDYGTTPATINKLLIGDYTVNLSKAGYASINRSVTIDEKKTAEISEKLVRGVVNFIEIVNSVKFEMIAIKGGSFQIEGNDVIISDYYMGQTEVTQELWETVMGNNPSKFKGKMLPVENVSWNDCQDFIKKLNQLTGKKYRLPTEVEWEYACRAGTTTPFHTGNCLSTSQANYDGNYPYSGCKKGKYRKKTTVVGSFISNAWGLYDMHGNVWEWCSDQYSSYINTAQISSTDLFFGSNRVYRGGSWINAAKDCQSANRKSSATDSSNGYVGFRLALTP